MKRLLLCVLFMLTACGGSNIPDQFTGTEGIEVSFVEDFPYEEVLEDRPVPVGLEVKNRGTWAVPEDKLALSWSYDPLYLSGPSGFTYPLTGLFEGRSEFYPAGDILYVEEFGFSTNKILGQRESPETKLHALACYQYRTSYSEPVCIDVDSYLRTGREQVCKGQDIVTSSQGAPVAVTRVETRFVPYETGGNFPQVYPEFIVTLRNVGGGVVLAPPPGFIESSFEEICTLEVPNQELNSVFVSGEVLGHGLRCDPMPVRLRDGEGRTHCVLTDEEKHPLYDEWNAQGCELLETSIISSAERARLTSACNGILQSAGCGLLDTNIVNPAAIPGLLDTCTRKPEAPGAIEDVNLALTANIVSVLHLDLEYVYRDSVTHTFELERISVDETTYSGKTPPIKGYAYAGDEIKRNDDGSLMTLCEEYVATPAEHRSNTTLSSDVKVNYAFSCACEKRDCSIDMIQKGFCTPGLCPGNLECCDAAAYESFKKAVDNEGNGVS